jgi:hypothetical protein
MYMDGALFHNNPIKVADKEWKLIWETNKSLQLDIMLSLGTGYREQQRQTQPTNGSLRRGFLSHAKFLHQIAQDHIADALDCEKAFDDHVTSFHTELREKFVRYNVKVDDLPVLDDVQALNSLQITTKDHLLKHSSSIKKLALQLIATSFYFETERVQQFPQQAQQPQVSTIFAF